jgi:hypothetical protein
LMCELPGFVVRAINFNGFRVSRQDTGPSGHQFLLNFNRFMSLCPQICLGRSF